MAFLKSNKYSCSCWREECDHSCECYAKYIEYNKKTNADRIRSMSDEELAELLTSVAKKSADKLCESLKSVEVDLSNCNFHILYEAHLDWLRQEVSDDDK